MSSGIKKEKSLKNALSKIGPTTEPCGTPEIISLKELLILLIRTHCFLVSKYEFMYLSKFLSKPQLSSLAIKNCVGCNRRP